MTVTWHKFNPQTASILFVCRVGCNLLSAILRFQSCQLISDAWVNPKDKNFRDPRKFLSLYMALSTLRMTMTTLPLISSRSLLLM